MFYIKRQTAMLKIIINFKGLLMFTIIFFSGSVFSYCNDKNLQIIAIGDSVTQGGLKPNEYSYRLQLSKMLNNTGYKVDFVGMQHGLPGENFKWPDGFDNDHEGFYGKTTLFVAEELKKDLTKLQANAPDIALILLGNNDQNKVNLFGAVVRPMQSIVKILREKNPKITILISTLNLNSINFKYIRWHLSLVKWLDNSKESRIILVSMHHGWHKQDTFDGIHPSLTGQKKIAKEWLQAIDLSCSTM